MFELKRLFDKANFDKQDEVSIRTLLESPEAAKIFERAEQESIEKRRSLRGRLDAIDGKHDKVIVSAGATVQAAMRAVEAAEAKLLAAREEQRLACSALYAAESAKGVEACELRQALRESRDLRLDEYWAYLDDAKDKLRHLTRVTSFPLGSWAGEKSIRYESNAEEVSVLSAALKEALGDVERMALLPLSRAEVSERLTEMTHMLEPMMDAFSLPTPRLDENGLVTLSRERLSFLDVLQDNGVIEPADRPQPQQSFQPHTVKTVAVKRSAFTPKRLDARATPPAVAASKSTNAKRVAKLGDGSPCWEEDYLLPDGQRVLLRKPM